MIDSRDSRRIEYKLDVLLGGMMHLHELMHQVLEQMPNVDQAKLSELRAHLVERTAVLKAAVDSQKEG